MSFDFWWDDLAAHCDTTVARMLVGNKCDLEDIRDVSVEEGKSLAEEEGLFFIETSALNSTNVNAAFEIVIREIYNNVSRKTLNSDSYKAELSVNRVSLANGIDLSKQNKSFSSCCSRWVSISIGGFISFSYFLCPCESTAEVLLKPLFRVFLLSVLMRNLWGFSVTKDSTSGMVLWYWLQCHGVE